MSTKQPEALRLADAIGGWHAPAHASIADCDQAAATLRTQYALLERAWNNLDAATSYSRKSARDSHSKLLADITAYLEMK